MVEYLGISSGECASEVVGAEGSQSDSPKSKENDDSRVTGIVNKGVAGGVGAAVDRAFGVAVRGTHLVIVSVCVCVCV